MTEALTPLDELVEFRKILVARRREIVSEVHQSRIANLEFMTEVGASDGANRGPALQAIQEQIEAIDHAMADEQQRDVTHNAPEKDSSFAEAVSYITGIIAGALNKHDILKLDEFSIYLRARADDCKQSSSRQFLNGMADALTEHAQTAR